MRKHVLVLTTTAAILSYGAIASAQAPGAQTPGTQQSPTTQPTPSGPMMQQQDQTRLQRRAKVAERKTAIRTATTVIPAE